MMEDELTLAAQMGLEHPCREVLEFLSFARSRMPWPCQVIDRMDLPTEHVSTPGLYLRTVTAVGPMLVASRVHATCHPFIVSAGECYVWDAKNGVQALVAPHRGVTEPGTFRLIFVPEEVVWTTCHATDETDPERIVETLSAPPPLAHSSLS